MCERELDNGSGSGFSLNRPSIGCFAKSFHQNGLFFFFFYVRGPWLSVKALLMTETNKCMRCFCTGSERVSVDTAAEWLDLLWLKIMEEGEKGSACSL